MTRKKWAKCIGSGLVLCWLAAGCGGITGDLPPVTGEVSRTDTNELLANAQVTLIAESGQQFVTYTDWQGRFSFRNMPRGHYNLVVQPPADLQPADLEAQELQFEDGSTSTFVAIGLSPASGASPPPAPERLIIEPAEKIVYLEPQPQTIQFTARLIGPDTADGYLQWMVRGNIGRIDWQGLFTPTRVGTGLVVAHIKGVEATAVVRVERRPLDH